MKKIFAMLFFAMLCGFTSIASANPSTSTMIMMGSAVNLTGSSGGSSNSAEIEKEKELKLAEYNALTPEEKEALHKKELILFSMVLAIGAMAVLAVIALAMA